MKLLKLFTFIVSVFLLFTSCSKHKDNIEKEGPTITSPPFSGTIFIAPNIIKPQDTSVFQKTAYEGLGVRLIFSRESSKWEDKNVYLFQANFSNGRPTIEIQVDTTGFTVDSATSLANKYSRIIGQLPVINRSGLQTVTVRKGMYAFGGGSHNLLIYTDYEKVNYDNQGIIEETLVHETTHISLDSLYSHSSEWLDAQKADGNYISTYAEENPDREDNAESFLLFLAVRYRSDRISPSLNDSIKNTIPNRIKFFDKQLFDVSPFK